MLSFSLFSQKLKIYLEIAGTKYFGGSISSRNLFSAVCCLLSILLRFPSSLNKAFLNFS